MSAVIGIDTASSEAAENWLHYILTTRTDHQIRLPEALRQGRQAGHSGTNIVAAKRSLQRDGRIEVARDHRGKLVWRLAVPAGRRAA